MSNIKVTQDQVDGFIKTTEVMTIGEKTTLVHATLENGFTITKTSACVDPENYDEKIGSEICMILHVIKKSKEYEKLSYTDIKEWAKDAARYQEKFKYKEFAGGTK